MKRIRYFLPLFLAAQSVWALNPHPRIWLTSTLLAGLTQKMNSSDPDWLRLKQSADSYKADAVLPYQRSGCPGTDICYDYEGGDGPAGWYDAMFTLALVYQVSGDSSYATKALQILDAANAPWKTSQDLSPIQLDTGYPTRTVLALLAIGYDWLYPALSSTEKADTIATINAAYTWFSTGASPVPYCMTGAYCKGNPYMNYFGGHVFGFGLAADATDGDNGNSSTIFNFVENLFTTTIAYGLQPDPVTIMPFQGGNYNLTTGGFNGGAVPEAYNYGPNHNMRMWKLLLAWKTSGRVDLTGTYAQWMKDSVKNLIYILRPNLWQVGDEGEYPGSCSAILPQGYPLFMAYMLSGSTEGGWAQYLYNNLATNPCNNTPGAGLVPTYYDAVLWKDSTRTATNYTSTLPLNYASDGDGHLLARSDWSSGALFMSFNGSGADWTDHMALTSGNLEVQHGSDYLLVGAQQWQGTAGWGGTPAIDSFNSAFSSTLYFNDGGAYLYTCNQCSGGQMGYGTTILLAQRADSSVSYALADLGSAYDIVPAVRAPSNRTARFYYRSVAYLGGNTVFVFDRFRSKSSAYTKRLQWHLNPSNSPTVNGSIVSTTVGASELFIDTLLPASPVITTSRDIATSDGMTPLTYNMQVSDSVSGTDLNALTVIYANASGQSLPATTSLTTIDANHVGVQVSDSTPLVAVFAQTVQDNGNNTYTPLTYTSATFTSTHSGTGKYLVTGLQPGAYSVLQGGVALPGYSATIVAADGTLVFNATSGAFSILPSGSTVSPCDLNEDGVINNLDIQVAITQALGSSPCTNADLDRNGICNVIDVQRVINAANGQACKIGP